ncbi:MAG: hypothetical protein ACR2GR_04770 [Rhodothermales bacterium]
MLKRFARKKTEGRQSTLLYRWVKSPAWFAAFCLTTLVCLSVYAIGVMMGANDPGGAWGLSYGIAATLLFALAMFYAARRRMLGQRWMGRTRTYLQLHVYGGSLFLLLVLMHTGFRLPQGPLAVLLWVLSLWVVVTGWLGVLLQKWIPRLLSAPLGVEVHYNRIAELVDVTRTRAEALADTGSEPFRTFYRRHLAPAFAAPRPRLRYFIDATGGAEARTSQFAYLRRTLPSEERPALDQLQALHQTKLEADAHYTLQRALRLWLYLHVPVSIAAAAALLIHIFAAIYYGGLMR